jgi:hypothetical protein
MYSARLGRFSLNLILGGIYMKILHKIQIYLGKNIGYFCVSIWVRFIIYDDINL